MTRKRRPCWPTTRRSRSSWRRGSGRTFSGSARFVVPGLSEGVLWAPLRGHRAVTTGSSTVAPEASESARSWCGPAGLVINVIADIRWRPRTSAIGVPSAPRSGVRSSAARWWLAQPVAPRNEPGSGPTQDRAAWSGRWPASAPRRLCGTGGPTDPGNRRHREPVCERADQGAPAGGAHALQPGGTDWSANETAKTTSVRNSGPARQRRALRQPLRPWVAMPSMKYFWPIVKMISIGRVTISAAVTTHW